MNTPTEVGTPQWLASELIRSRVLDSAICEERLRAFMADHPYADASALAGTLVQEGLLSPFQAERALEGDAKKLVLGPYLLLESVGVGSMGVVYRARGRADGQDYALKVLPARAVWHIKIARRQVKAFSDLPPHPGVVPFLDIGTANGQNYLVWPFVKGETLQSRVERQGPLPPAEAARIGLQIASALRHTSSRGLFHGALKPANIALDAAGVVKVLDFGIGALLAENLDQEESLIDTISTANASSNMMDYLSPEVIFDPVRRTAASDQYSLGCVLYFLLTGHPPFAGGTTVEKIMRHQTKLPRPLLEIQPAIGQTLSDIVGRLLNKSAEARFGGFEEIETALAPLAGPQPLSLPATTPTPPARPTPAPGTITVQLPGSSPKSPSLTQTPEPSVRRLSAFARAMAPTPPVSAPQFESQVQVPPMLPAPPPLPRSASPTSLADKLKRALLFWAPVKEFVQCSVFAKPTIAVGQAMRISVILHAPHDMEALHHWSHSANLTLLGTGSLNHKIQRGSTIELHLATDQISPTMDLQSSVWEGQMVEVGFVVRIPENVPIGDVACMLSVGLMRQLIGQVPFRFRVV